MTSTKSPVIELLAMLSRLSLRMDKLSSSWHQLDVLDASARHDAPGHSASSSRQLSDTQAVRDSSSDPASGQHPLVDKDNSASIEAALAAATALQNLVLDEDAQSLVVNQQGIPIIAKLLTSACWVLSARAAGKTALLF